MSLDIQKLLDEVTTEVNQLLKSSQEDVATIKKAEKTDVKKADDPDKEGSGYESQAPEASAPPAEAAPQEEMSADPAQDAPPAEGQPAAEGEQGHGDKAEELAQVMQGLDDETLHELYQEIKMELMARMQQKEEPQAEQAPEASAPPAEAAPQEEMSAMKSEKSDEDLKKAEVEAKNEEIGKLKKSLEDYEKSLAEMTDMLKIVLERPVQRALSDISFVDKNESLKKSELSDEDLKKAVDSLSRDRKKLSTLTKNEVDTIQDFYAGRNVKEKIIQIVNK